MKKHRIPSYIIMVILSMLSIHPLFATPSKTQVVKVGFYQNPGFHNQDKDGEYSGYGYDFLQLVRRHTQMEFAYVGYDKSWEESLEMLKRGEVDLLTGALYTPEREKVFDYSYPIGSTQLNLYIHTLEKRFLPNKYASYEGMRIGTVKSEMLGERVQKMANRNHFHATIVDFEDFSSMCKALDQNEIDAMCAIGTHLITGYRILESFDQESIYAIVRKGNVPLLEALNNTIVQMDQNMMMWPLKLYEENYLLDNSLALEFSEAEQAFIRSHSSPGNAIKIATDHDWKPYSWYEDGKHQGIIVEIIDKLMKMAGLEYEFVKGEISNEQVLASHPEVDLYADFVSNPQYAEEQDLILTPAFMHSTISIISTLGYNQLKTIGLSKNTPMLNKEVQKNYNQFDFVVYPSTEEQLQAVKKGKVDGAMMYDYMAQLYINTEEDNRIQISFIPSMTLPLHMATRDTDERELITIVSKCINHLNRTEVSNITTKYLSASEAELNVWHFLKHNPWFIVIVLFLSLSGFMFEKYKRLKMELQKQKLVEVNIAANEAKTQFLHNMSHEIRTPLNAMFGFAQLLGMPDGSCTEEEKEQYNRYIYNSYRLLEMLISDILDVADMEHGNYRIEIADTLVNETCEGAIQSVEFRVPAEVRLYFTTDCPADLSIQSDGRRIQQVLINYLTNACKNTEEGEIHLHCSLTERPGWVTFSVTDTGRGVPKEKAEIIFSRFTKLNQFVQGSGLGLNICQTIANKLGGEVFLDTTYTHGARFVFSLPLAEAKA